MKSIKQQYIDLMEGKMSQHNFMRSLRMTMPQYVTNVTSFKDSVKILKNKGILSEAMGGDPIEATLKSYLAKGYSYAEAIELTAAEQGMDEEVLMSQYPQDAVDTEGYEDEGDDDEFIDMIAKAEEEEAGKYTKFDDFEGGLSEKNLDVDPKQLRIGIKVEMEHTDDLDMAKKIALDHLAENPRYYTKLKRAGLEEIKEAKERKGSSSEEQYSKFSEAEKDNLQELTTGINIEHECFPEKTYEEIEKIVLKNIRKNPNYYTDFKLTGIRDYKPQTMDASTPESHQMKFVKGEDSYVDKERGMKPVKGAEKAKASSNKAKKETNSGVKGVEELTHNAKSVRGLQKFAATGGKMKAVREGQLNEGGEWTITGTLTKDEQTELKNMIGNYDLDVQATDDTLETTISHPMYNDKSLEQALKQVRGMLPKNPSFRPGVDLGKYDLKSLLEKMVREVLDEMYDGRDDMNAQYAQDEIK